MESREGRPNLKPLGIAKDQLEARPANLLLPRLAEHELGFVPVARGEEDALDQRDSAPPD